MTIDSGILRRLGHGNIFNAEDTEDTEGDRFLANDRALTLEQQKKLRR